MTIEPAKKRRASPWLVLAVLIGIGWVCRGVSGEQGTSGPPTTTGPDPVGAYVVCQQFVEDRLKAPVTAEFGGPYSQVTKSLGGGRFVVDTYVDSQNSFGAMIRTEFSCTVQNTGGDNWHLESLTFD